MKDKEKYVEEKARELYKEIIELDDYLRAQHLKGFIATIVEDCQPEVLASMTKYVGTNREEWIRIK